MYSSVCVSLSYDTRNVFSLFSVKYKGSRPLNSKDLFFLLALQQACSDLRLQCGASSHWFALLRLWAGLADRCTGPTRVPL